MQAVGEYLLRLSTAAILCGAVTGLTGGDGAVGKTVKMMSTIFMLFTLISPLTQLPIENYEEFFDGISAEASDAVYAGEKVARESLADIIKTETEAYILDKADSCGASIQAEVTLSGDAIPVPRSVTIRGQFSPYAKQRMMVLIQDDLGISQEEQTWIAHG